MRGVISVVVVGLGWYWHTSTRSNEVPTRYATEKAVKGTVVSSINASGNIVVDQIANIDPTISGTVENLSVKVGDTVQKGQRLFTISNDQLSVSMKKAAISVRQSQTAIDSAHLDVKSAQANYALSQKSSSSSTKKQREVLKGKIDIAKAQEQTARESYAATVADYQRQVDDANKRIVTAPLNGTVNAVNIKNGDDLGKTSSNGNETPIIIGDLTTLQASVEVNEVDISSVAIGQKATLTFDAISNLTATGKVEKIDSLGTLSSGVVNYTVTVGFDMLDARIRPGMSVSTALITNTKQDVLSVSNGAVKTKKDGSVYVQVLANGVPEDRIVTIGLANNTKTEIVSGIKEGDEIVVQTIAGTAAAAVNAVRPTTSGIPGLTGGSSGGTSRRGLGL